jgi:hypothetical protein
MTMSSKQDIIQLEPWQYIDQIKIVILNSYEDIESLNLIEIAGNAADKFALDPDTAYKYAKTALKQITDLLSLKRSTAIIKAVCERELLYLYAKNDHNIRLASDLLKDRDRLLGLYTPVSGNINIADCSNEELLYYQDSLFADEEFK